MIDVRTHANGCCVSIHVTPGAKKPSIGGEHGGALRVAVREVAEKGKANQAVIEAIAEVLGISKSECEVISGHTGRRKTIYINGWSVQNLQAKMNELGAARP